MQSKLHQYVRHIHHVGALKHHQCRHTMHCKPFANTTHRPIQQQPLSLTLRASSNTPNGEPSSPGDETLQERLVDILRVQINQKEVEDFAEQKKEQLTQAAEEIKEQVDEFAKQQAEASDAVFDNVLEEMNRKVDAFEEELRKDRERVETDALEFQAWQRKMAAERSRGQFFKSLYQADETPIVGEDLSMLKAQAEERATQDLQQELSSGRRLLLFAFLTAVLLSVAAVDALSEQPSWPQITLYVLLAAMFGAITVGEKKFLAEWKEQGPARDRGGKW